jgi:hypothetical protein
MTRVRARRRRERGTAILITMVIVVALLGGGAVLVGLQLASTRSTEITRSGMTALYCAEAGLNAARPLVANNYTSWNTSLCNGCVVGSAASELPFITTGINHDLDGDGVNDFVITLKDNDDEFSPVPANASVDNDLQVWVISTCTKFPDNQKQVSELVRFNLSGTCYDKQLGGCGGNGNAN